MADCLKKSPVITLLTDYGVNDWYVASVKGTILSINSEVNIIDICNTIEPQNVFQASFIIGTIYRFFPAGSIHIVIVDPEVGSNRKSIILSTGYAYFIAPDNGVLSFILIDKMLSIYKAGSKPRKVLKRVKLPAGYKAIEISNQDYWLNPVSATFHGRDIFAPVAAHLSEGRSIRDFGIPLSYINVYPIPQPYKDSNGFLYGNIMHIDRFGNLITNIPDKAVGYTSTVKLGKVTIRGLKPYYAAGRGLMALIGSSNYLEIALRNGSAKDFLGVHVGDIVQIIDK